MMRKATGLFPEFDQELEQGCASAPGVLPSQAISALISQGAITSRIPINESQVQPSSIDLRLGPVAYRVRASFLPGKTSTVNAKIEAFKMHELDLSKPAVLEKGCVYIIPVLEELCLPRQLSGKANPKSSTGRLDIFTRLIRDYGGEFENVPQGYRGKLYVEVVPRTFSVLVRQGTKLNQLRLIRGRAPSSDAKLDKLDAQVPLVYLPNDAPGQAKIDNGLCVSIGLAGVDGQPLVGYRAKHHAPLLDLSQRNYYEPLDFWDPIMKPSSGALMLDPDDFYILVSKERIRVPPHFSAAMVPYDPSVGEFRVHYAGFFDPGFGYGSDNVAGTRAILEVRSHGVPLLLEDGQIVGRLIYEQLTEAPDKVYGSKIGSSYECQGLALSKQFKRAPRAPS